MQTPCRISRHIILSRDEAINYSLYALPHMFETTREDRDERGTGDSVIKFTIVLIRSQHDKFGLHDRVIQMSQPLQKCQKSITDLSALEASVASWLSYTLRGPPRQC